MRWSDFPSFDVPALLLPRRHQLNTAAAAASAATTAALPAAAEPLLERGVADDPGEREGHPAQPGGTGLLSEAGDPNEQDDHQLEVAENLSLSREGRDMANTMPKGGRLRVGYEKGRVRGSHACREQGKGTQ